jgi:hypothetical protein
MSHDGWKAKDTVSLISTSAAAAASLLVGYHVYLRNSDHQSKYLKLQKLPDEIHWLDQQTFEVFTALCDTIVPSYTVQECNTDRIVQAFDQIHPRLKTFDTSISVSAMEKMKTYICAGAVEHSTHKHCALALERTTTKSEKRQLYLVLKLLSTSIGSFLLTGYPVPFQVC